MHTCTLTGVLHITYIHMHMHACVTLQELLSHVTLRNLNILCYVTKRRGQLASIWLASSPAFQCFTLKNGRAWYAKSCVLHDVISTLMNVGVRYRNWHTQTASSTHYVHMRRLHRWRDFAAYSLRPSFSFVL